MNRLLISSCVVLFLCAIHANAQIAKTNIIEHFTNTSCSSCAAANPIVQAALEAHPGTLRISFHPSSPYSNDFFNTQNMVENDARTNFYGVYGATPRLIVNGLPYSTGSISNTLSSLAGGMTNYKIQLTQTDLSNDNVNTEVVIKKIAEDDITDALLFVGAVEDTIYQTTNNGETIHYDVFRKTLTAIGGDAISMPIMVGDSVVFNLEYEPGINWQRDQLRSIGILQEINKNVINSARSNSLPDVAASIAEDMDAALTNLFYPNPFTGDLKIDESVEQFSLYNQFGQLVFFSLNTQQTSDVDLTSLSQGIYIVVGYRNEYMFTQKLIKR